MDDVTRERDMPGSAPEETRPPEKRRGLRRSLGPSIGIVAVLAMIIAGTLYWLDTRHFETTDDAFIDTYTTQVAPRVAGQVTKLLFADNQHVTAGQTLLLIEAMKTFNQIKAPKAGTVTAILVQNSSPVEYGEVLLILE